MALPRVTIPILVSISVIKFDLTFIDFFSFSVSCMLLFTIIMLSRTRRLSHQKTNLGDNCIQNVHLGRYIVGYMLENFVLRRRVSGAVKRNLRSYNG